MSLGIKKNDTVQVLSGREKGKRGRVIGVLRDSDRVLVERVNLVKKHMKPNKQYSQGGIIDKEAPIRRSNVMLVCPKCDKPTRIAARVFDETKSRVCKKCKEVIDK